MTEPRIPILHLDTVAEHVVHLPVSPRLASDSAAIGRVADAVVVAVTGTP